jgi:hypothetical protein
MTVENAKSVKEKLDNHFTSPSPESWPIWEGEAHAEPVAKGPAGAAPSQQLAPQL